MTAASRFTEATFKGVRVHVIGLGAYGTGREVARALAGRGAEVTVSDIKPEVELADERAALANTGVRVLAGERAYEGIEKAELVVPSPGVPLDILPLRSARAAQIPIVSEIEIAFLLARCPIVAVSGTKGKSTTTSLIGAILQEEGFAVRVGGNIGRPLVALADQAGGEEILVAEVSSFQLEATRYFRPKVATLLNIFPDHLDRHHDMNNYRAVKAKLFANQQQEDRAVINRDNPEVWSLREEIDASLIPFSLLEESPEGADLLEGWLRVKEQSVCQESDVQLRGRHNLANVLAALATSAAAGAKLERAQETVRQFKGLEHRLEAVAVIKGALFVNDSQSTTPEATMAALDSFPEHVILIAGGRSKVCNFTALTKRIAIRGVDLVLIGEAAEEIATAARSAGVDSITVASDLQAAVMKAEKQARPGDVVLLSPACASFDMFQDMAERGRQFKEIVKALPGGKEGAP